MKGKCIAKLEDFFHLWIRSPSLPFGNSLPGYLKLFGKLFLGHAFLFSVKLQVLSKYVHFHFTFLFFLVPSALPVKLFYRILRVKSADLVLLLEIFM